MPVLAVLIPAFKLAVARRGTSVGEGPVLVADKRERGRVVDCSAAAAALGARRGMTLVQAQAVARDALTLIDDPAADTALWSALLDALDAASPLVEDAGQGCAYLEMHGIEGGAPGWLAAVRETLAGFDLPIRLGLGPNKFVARAAAMIADGTIAQADPRTLLAPLPLELLDCPPGALDRLRLLGITTLGELAALPHGPFVRRFGTEGACWHAWARGVDDAPLVPRPRAMKIDRARYGEGTAESEEAVLFALRGLVAEVVADLELAGKRCGRLILTLECEDGETHDLTTSVAQPTAQPHTLFELLRARLEGLRLSAPVIGARLSAGGLENGGVPLTLFAASDPDPEALGLVLARLEAALGEHRALRARVVTGTRPEQRYAVEPFTIETLVTKTWLALPPGMSALPAQATLQYRARDPAPIAVSLDRGRPAFVGTPPQAVLEFGGPWRVDEAWWSRATGAGTLSLERDDYDVLLEDGALYRIACCGSSWTLCGTYD